VTAGSPGRGGAGGTRCVDADGGGGGGAGFEGGGGGGDFSGGGGGSSFPAATFTATGGITVTPEADTNTNAGDGKVVITYSLLSSATTLTSSGPNPSSFGQSVSFTATVSPADGGGTVTFKDAGTPITGCAGESLTHLSGTTYTAGCTTSTLPGGTDAITASYSGDSTYTGSGSNTIDQVVNADRTRLRAAGEVTASGDIFVSAALTAGGRPVAGQLITFTAGPGITVCTASTNGSGVATCAASQEGGAMIALGEGVFTATFAGTANDDAAQATGFVTGR
jgi:hypothetical protein